MAPRKEKSEKQSLDQGSSLVLEYLKKQNRPYSATDISSNLHNKVTKTNAAKYLKELHDAQKIECRVSGKQMVYHALQDDADTTTSQAENQETLDEQLIDLRAKIAVLKGQEKTLKQKLSSLSTMRSFEELQASYTALQARKIELTEQITALKDTNKDIKPVSEAEGAHIDSEHAKWSSEARLRSEAVRNLWLLVMDVCERTGLHDMSKDDFWEHVGCEGPVPK